MSDDWSRVSSALGGYKYRADCNTRSETPSNISLAEANAMRDSFKGNGSDDGDSTFLRNGGGDKSTIANDLVRTNASDAESDIYVIGSRPASQKQDRTTTIPGFTAPKSDMNGQSDIPAILPPPSISQRASPTYKSGTFQLNSPYRPTLHDPNAPKRPLGPFSIYFEAMHPKIRQEMNEHPDCFVDAQGVPMYAFQVTMNRWNAMTLDQQEPYKAAYRAALENYEVAMAAYKAAIGSDDTTVTPQGYSAPDSFQALRYSSTYPYTEPNLASQNNLAAAGNEDKKLHPIFKRATVETESEPGPSPPASVKGSDLSWDGLWCSNCGLSLWNCSCSDYRVLNENDSCDSPVQEPKTTKNSGGWVRKSSVGRGSPSPRRDGWGAASVSSDGDTGGWGSENPHEERLKPTPTGIRRYCNRCGASVGWCDCDEIASRGREDLTFRNPVFRPWSECSEDAGDRASATKHPANSMIGNAVPPHIGYSYANYLAGAGGVYNASHNAMNLPRQPAGIDQATQANYQPTVADYEAHIRELQAQVQTQGSKLAFQEKVLAKYPPNFRDDSEFAARKTEFNVSTGRNTGLRKEVDFLRQRLASGSLSTEDRAKAIDIVNLIEGKPGEEPLTTKVSKGGATKSTTFNVSSNGHENGSANVALDMKMHDLTKSMTKMKAFHKFQRMQQGSDRLARIEEKLVKSQDQPREKTKESDRVTAFQKRTAREVEKLNKRLDELLSSKKTETGNKGELNQELQNIRSLVGNLNIRFEDNDGLMASVSEDIQEMRSAFAKNEKASNAAGNEGTSPLFTKPKFKAASLDSWGEPLERKNSRASWAPRSPTEDYPPFSNGCQHAYSPVLVTPRPDDPPSNVSAQQLAPHRPVSPTLGWCCRSLYSESIDGSEIEDPGRFTTVASTVSEDFDPAPAFWRKKSSSPGEATPGSSWEGNGLPRAGAKAKSPSPITISDAACPSPITINDAACPSPITISDVASDAIVRW